jgi:hypothetical protein
MARRIGNLETLPGIGNDAIRNLIAGGTMPGHASTYMLQVASAALLLGCAAKQAPREFAWQTGTRCTDGNPMLYVDNPLPGDVIVTESFRASANVPGHGVVLERVGKGLARIPVKNDRRYSYYVRPTNRNATIESEAGKETVRYWVRCEPA